MKRLVIAVLAVALMGGACSVLPGGGDRDGYKLVAMFDRAVGLYPHGDVSVMGIGVGSVDSVEVEDTHVRIEMTIDSDVPLPADVRATIEPLTLIGERNVVLFPAWNEAMADAGKAKARDGDVIPQSRTEVPVEPDEGLEAFNDLARSLDPSVVSDLVSDTAEVVRGRGDEIGAILGDAATIGSVFGDLDAQLLNVAESLHAVAGSLSTRQTQLQSLVDTFAAATTVLASERDGIEQFLSSLVDLTDVGGRLLDLYSDQLPGDIANLTALMMILSRNSGAIENLFAGMPGVAEGIANAYQPEIDGIALRASGTPSFIALIDTIGEILGINPVEQP